MCSPNTFCSIFCLPCLTHLWIHYRFTLDLVEVYFQIVHTRIPLLDPAQFRLRLNLQADPRHSGQVHKPLHPALVATVLAWGCKFSEHPLLVADRRRPSGQSHLAKAMVDRARELAETMKVHRIPSADHVVVCLLIEPLQSRELLQATYVLPRSHIVMLNF